MITITENRNIIITTLKDEYHNFICSEDIFKIILKDGKVIDRSIYWFIKYCTLDKLNDIVFIETKDTILYFKNRKLHNVDGPAIIQQRNILQYNVHYCLNDIFFSSKEEWESSKEMRKYKLKKLIK